MGRCYGRSDGMDENVKDVLKKWFAQPEVQSKLNSSRSKLIASGILIKLRG